MTHRVHTVAHVCCAQDVMAPVKVLPDSASVPAPESDAAKRAQQLQLTDAEFRSVVSILSDAIEPEYDQ